ncbi:hypothetical protein SNE40_015706 [Patella caerulea]|uniref:TNFR-Cys domain-containing protein n=1 Tax=Patella caerulea TaxID=87958 RepID=A0AAN8JHW5_PATCE
MVIKTCFLLMSVCSIQVLGSNHWNCQPCDMGMYMETQCQVKGGKSVCKPCPKDTYNEKSDFSLSCGDCSVCEMTQVVLLPCSPVSDTVCGCPYGKVWQSDGADGICVEGGI